MLTNLEICCHGYSGFLGNYAMASVCMVTSLGDSLTQGKLLLWGGMRC
jgi:hypothetical protein